MQWQDVLHEEREVGVEGSSDPEEKRRFKLFQRLPVVDPELLGEDLQPYLLRSSESPPQREHLAGTRPEEEGASILPDIWFSQLRVGALEQIWPKELWA